MNLYLGLTRISAVFWGLIAGITFLGMAADALGNRYQGLFLTIIILVAYLFLSIIFFIVTHGTVRWILKGFFGKS